MSFRVIGFSVATVFSVLLPTAVFADRCDDAMDRASMVFDSAGEAYKQEQYSLAIILYEQAEELYGEASRMKNCRCSKTTRTALKNIKISQNNIALSRDALENLSVFETYEQAKEQFNQGNSFARNRQWPEAIYSFEEAERIWGSIAGTDTENGRRAQQMAQRSRELAQLARQRSGM